MPRRPPPRSGQAQPTQEPAPAHDLPPEPNGLFGSYEPDAARLGERVRRLALGLTAALIAVRFYWPSEDADEGSGLVWVLAILVTLALTVLSWWLGGTTRVRWSWADAAVLVLVAIVGLSSIEGADHRAAVSVAWEWVGLGVAYGLLRWLPRTRGEVSVVAGSLIVTACAVAAVGFYQIRVEDPKSRAEYHKNPERALAMAGVENNPVSRHGFESRLFDSHEPRATFALANSLAGFLVGPSVFALAVLLENVTRREGRSRRFWTVALATPPILLLFGCLLLTKSRSAWIGLSIGLVTVAWRERVGVPRRVLITTFAGVAIILAGLVGLGVATRQLDREVITEGSKSFGYRLEYWKATWALIRESSSQFWRGVGPGNFAGPYLRHKLPSSSEEIKDPHNLVLDVWATSGAFGAFLLVLALGLVSRETLGRPRVSDAERVPTESLPAYPGFDESKPPISAGWLWPCTGLGSWLGVVALGQMNPFGDEMGRWLVLGLAWGWSAVMIAPLWRRRPISGVMAGAGALAVMINLLAAGGISLPSVALGLWALAALGQNLREDRPCGRLRALPGRGIAMSFAMLVAALIGSFYGANAPTWRRNADMAEARAALNKPLPDFAKAREAYLHAANADTYSSQPWVELAAVEYRDWQANGPKPSHSVGIKIASALEEASKPPRNPRILAVQRLRVDYADALLRLQGEALSNADQEWLKRERANGAAQAVAFYPNDANLQATLAVSVAAIGRFADAARHAREALALDAITPHTDKKLSDEVREGLKAAEQTWEQQVPSR